MWASGRFLPAQSLKEKLPNPKVVGDSPTRVADSGAAGRTQNPGSPIVTSAGVKPGRVVHRRSGIPELPYAVGIRLALQ
jgi:hypothetical protein